MGGIVDGGGGKGREEEEDKEEKEQWVKTEEEQCLWIRGKRRWAMELIEEAVNKVAEGGALWWWCRSIRRHRRTQPSSTSGFIAPSTGLNGDESLRMAAFLV